MTVPASIESQVVLRTSGDERVPQRLYEHVLDVAGNLVLLDTPFPEELLAHMRQMSQRRGHSIYAWNQDTGLASLREHGITVAGSKRLAEAVRFILQSGHFGVYVLPPDRGEYTPQVMALMRQIARVKEGGKRVLVLGTGINIPALLPIAQSIVHKHGPSDHLRLRDGRWIRG